MSTPNNPNGAKDPNMPGVEGLAGGDADTRMSQENEADIVGLDMTPEVLQVYIQILYAYILGKNNESLPQEEKEKLLTAEMENDYKKYKSHIEPRPGGISNEDWEHLKKTRLVLAKRMKVLQYAIGNPVINGTEDMKRISELMDQAEVAEEGADIDAEERPANMSDEDWSNMKKTLLENWSKENGEEDKKQQDELLDQGAENSREQHINLLNLDSKVQPFNPTVPKEIRHVYNQVVKVMWQWWTNDPSEKDESTVAVANMNLKHLGRKDEELIASSFFRFQMKTAADAIAKCELSSNPGNTRKLIGFVISLTNLFRKHNLDWRMLAPVSSMAWHTRLLRVLHASNDSEVKSLTKAFEDSYFEVMPEQNEILQRVKLITPHIETGLKKGDKTTLTVCIDQLKGLNSDLEMINWNCAIRGEDHSFPVRDLEQYVNNLENGQRKDYIAKLVYKMDLLHIPGIESFKDFLSDYTMTAELEAIARNEALGIASQEVKSPANLVEGVQGLGIAEKCGLAYSIDEQQTVGWGHKHGSRFYINMYGPDNAPVFRRERYATSSWLKTYPDEPPIALQVSNMMNRLGEVKNKSTGKLQWKVGDIADIYGIAWQEDRIKYPEEEARIKVLDPDEHEQGESPWPDTYVLIGWRDPKDGFGVNLMKRWETRATLRQRYGSDEADAMIYEYACKAQNRFDDWRNGKGSGTTAATTSLKGPVVGEAEIAAAKAAVQKKKAPRRGREHVSKRTRSNYKKGAGQDNISREDLELYYDLRKTLTPEKAADLFERLYL